MRVAPPPRRKKGAAPPPQNNGMPAHSPASAQSVRRPPVSTLRAIAAKMRMRDSRIWRALGTRPPHLPRTARLRLQFPRGSRDNGSRKSSPAGPGHGSPASTPHRSPTYDDSTLGNIAAEPEQRRGRIYYSIEFAG